MGISQMLMKLAEGMATSCWIFGITLLFSLPLGMVRGLQKFIFQSCEAHR